MGLCCLLRGHERRPRGAKGKPIMIAKTVTPLRFLVGIAGLMLAVAPAAVRAAGAGARHQAGLDRRQEEDLFRRRRQEGRVSVHGVDHQVERQAERGRHPWRALLWRLDHPSALGADRRALRVRARSESADAPARRGTSTSMSDRTSSRAASASRCAGSSSIRSTTSRRAPTTTSRCSRLPKRRHPAAPRSSAWRPRRPRRTSAFPASPSPPRVGARTKKANSRRR